MKMFIKRFNNKIKRPLKRTKANSGESLIEVLVSLLIISVSFALLITTLTSASGLIKTSQEKFSDYYDQNNELTTQTGTPDASGTVELRFVSLAKDGAENQERANCNSDVESATKEWNINVSYYINENAKKETIASFKGVFTTHDGGSGGTDAGDESGQKNEDNKNQDNG